jgi:hypothetical protein
MVNLEMLWWARRTASPRIALAHGHRDVRPAEGDGAPGPVLLATVRNTPFAAAATDLAVDLAREIDAPLIVANLVDAPATRTRRVDPGPPQAVAAAIRAPAGRAAAEGIPATVLHVRALRTVDALIALVADTGPAIVVFGADPARLSHRHLSRRAYRRAVAALEARTSCLLWRVTPDSPVAAVPRRVRRPVHR